jgi:hypothetical protein
MPDILAVLLARVGSAVVVWYSVNPVLCVCVRCRGMCPQDISLCGMYVQCVPKVLASVCGEGGGVLDPVG